MRRFTLGLVAGLLVVGWLSLGSAAPVAATEVRIFQTESRSDFLAGTPDGVGIDPLGRLELADRVDRLTAVGEPFVLSAANHPDGWVLGTGNAGRVLLVDRDGNVTELFQAPEPEVFAVWADPDGTVFAGTSPEGKVYRISPDGVGEAFFEPGETYVWDLARDGDGGLLVATGTQGKVFRVDDSGDGSLLYDTDDTHVRSVVVRPDGDVLLGTAGEGLVLALSSDGSGGVRARTLHDASAPEVVALTTGPDGSGYAALVASEASLVELGGSSSPSSSSGSDDDSDGDDEDDDGGSVQVSTDGGPSASMGSRRPGFRGPRTEIVRIDANGLVESLAELDDETVFALRWTRGRLWVGTGLEGKLYSLDPADPRLVLEKDVDERQIVALMDGDPGPAFATTNAAAVYRVTADSEREGRYTSAVLDAEQIARFGSFRWFGDASGDGTLRFSFRSGMSSEPDRTWSDWTAWRTGREIDVGDVPRGRYVQWRVELTADGSGSPVLSGAELSYLQENLAPEIEKLEVMEPGQILVEANFNPTSQVFEPVSPNKDGIFTTLEKTSRNGDPRLKPLWKKGYRTLRWDAEDPNEDALRYRIEFSPDDGGDLGDDWLPVAEDLEDEHYSFDATVLPDGIYRFRLTASDAPDNLPDGARTARQITEPVVVDHTAPELAGVEVVSGSLEVRVTDAYSPLRQAEISLDAGEWKPAIPTDRLLDGRAETFRLEVPEGTRMVILRILDAAHNSVAFDLSEHLP